MEYEIVYSLRVLKQLVGMGHIPVQTMPNPKIEKYNCWVFENTKDFQKDLKYVLEEVLRND